MSQPNEPWVVVVWGDSIAASGWPQQVEFSHNVAQNTGQTIRMVNSGIGGMPAAKAREQFDEKVAAHKPNVVIIQFGFNDMRHDGSRGALPLSTPDEFQAHLEHMATRCMKELNAKVLVYGNHRANRITILPTGLAYDQARAVYTDRAEAAARNAGAVFLDMAKVFQLGETPWTALVNDDGVHLTGAGQTAYVSVTSTAIMWLIEGKNPAEEFARRG
ncbi:MAG: SGNH/GDSL hydrolase family protein [Planctomycetes bacterium]|nr:SGNH/GDSL hydrolase family protein [Planctomycetota bacterium]